MIKKYKRILISFSGKNFQDEQLAKKYIFCLTSVKPSCTVRTSCTVLVLQKKIKEILALKRRDRDYKIDSSRTVWAILIR